MRQPTINWIGVDSLSNRHGVEFLYGGQQGYCMAFLRGYEWLRKPSLPLDFEILRLDASRVLDEVRDAVITFLRERGNHGPIKGTRVFAWFNA